MVFGRIRATNWFIKELKKIKQSPEQIEKRIAIFIEEYNRQYSLIPDKLKMAHKLKHTEQYNRIVEYKEDIEALKKKMDRFIFDIQDEDRKRTLGERIKHSKMGTFMLIFRDMNRINKKYIKENCDIDNFEV